LEQALALTFRADFVYLWINKKLKNVTIGFFGHSVGSPGTFRAKFVILVSSERHLQIKVYCQRTLTVQGNITYKRFLINMPALFN
jgi:hypothetical protein